MTFTIIVTFQMDTKLQTNLTKSMIAQVGWVWDFDNTPAPDRERSDQRRDGVVQTNGLGCDPQKPGQAVANDGGTPRFVLDLGRMHSSHAST